jgi:hypothetical protein
MLERFCLGILPLLFVGMLTPGLAPLEAHDQSTTNIEITKAAFRSRVGGVWIGEGLLTGLGPYRSERRFIQVNPNQIVVLHKMTVRRMVMSSDSLLLTFGSASVTLAGADSRGNDVNAKLVGIAGKSSFTFDDGDKWRSVYSAFLPESFVLDVYTNQGGAWTSYLQTVHRRAK